MANFKNIKTVTLGQTRSLVSTRLYVFDNGIKTYSAQQNSSPVDMGIVWTLLDVKKPSLKFAQIILEYTALALQTAQALGIVSSICLLSSPQRHSMSLYLNRTNSFSLREVPFCSSLVEPGDQVHVPPAYSLHIFLHPKTLKS